MDHKPITRCRTQQDALDVLKKHKLDLQSIAQLGNTQPKEEEKVWAEDLSERNNKTYLVATVSDFKLFYDQQKEKHFHEMILPDQPCHLYLDFDYAYSEHTAPSETPEYPKTPEHPENPKQQFELEMEKELFIGEIIEQLCFHVEGLNEDDISVIELDSSDDSKYSRHVHFRIRNGLIMFRSYEHVHEFLKRVPNCPSDSFDWSVYSRYRTFRLEGSTKIKNPKRVLRIVTEGFTFEDTLIQHLYVPQKTCLLQFKLEKPKSKTLLTFPNQELLGEIIGGITKIESKWTKIQPLSFTPETGVLLLRSDSKFCLQKGTEHRSNHVNFYVYLKGKRPHFVQGCLSHNPRCVFLDIDDNVQRNYSAEIHFEGKLADDIRAEFAPDSINTIASTMVNLFGVKSEIKSEL